MMAAVRARPAPMGAILSRATESLAALLVFIDHPVIGVGPGMFRYYYGDYAEYVGLRVLTTDRQAHNLYLGVAAETGALGEICFLLILYVTLRNLARVRKRLLESNPELANMATAFMLAIITYMTTVFSCTSRISATFGSLWRWAGVDELYR